MTLLREIRVAATDSEVKLPDLLRKCKVLAARLRHQEFAEWVGRELNGYPDAAGLPEYRRVHVESLGKFVGPLNSGIDNARIPTSALPENLKHHANEARFFDSVSSLGCLADDEGTTTLCAKWSADVVAYVAKKHPMYRDMVLIDAWQVISSATVAGILDTVRTRILDFVLALEAEDPAAGDSVAHVRGLAQPVPHTIRKVTGRGGSHC